MAEEVADDGVNLVTSPHRTIGIPIHARHANSNQSHRVMTPMAIPSCLCCGWAMGPLDLTAPGRDGLCLLCDTAGCTAAMIGPIVERPEVHRRPETRRAAS